jgi:hypothetical protein
MHPLEPKLEVFAATTHLKLDNLATAVAEISKNQSILQGTVVLQMEEYLKMRDVYEKNKDKRYIIELSINHRQFVNGEKISDLRTQEFNFPDDTETKLSELFRSVHENSQYVAHLQKQLEESEEARAYLDKQLRKAQTALNQRGLWNRIFS